VPNAAVPDNLKAGITKPSRYEPGVNRTYQDLADHYGLYASAAPWRAALYFDQSAAGSLSRTHQFFAKVFPGPARVEAPKCDP
jgi:hypothetical protein